MGGHDMINPTFFSRSLKGRCYSNWLFWLESAETGIVHFHSVRWFRRPLTDIFETVPHDVHLANIEKLLYGFSENTP